MSVDMVSRDITKHHDQCKPGYDAKTTLIAVNTWDSQREKGPQTIE